MSTTIVCAKCNGVDVMDESGIVICAMCGHIVLENNLVEEVQFIKGPGGQSRMQGAFVRNCSNEYASMMKRLKRGEDQISILIMSLKIDDSIEHHANTYYNLASQRGFTRRYRVEYVAAACLYVACRAKEKPYLLIDFSEKLGVSVYVLGAVFLQLCQLLLLQEHPIIQKPVDPSLFIHKFVEALVSKVDKDDVRSRHVFDTIRKTALRIVASMKRDWMTTGRKPSGLCGAAIYIAALANGIRFSKSEVMTVVHICEATLTKRLIEFENTVSGSLTIDEFNQRAEELEEEQPDGHSNKSDEAEVLCRHKGERVQVHAHGLCKECYDEFIQLSGGLNGGADPPSFQRPESEEEAQNISGMINGPSTEYSHGEHTLGIVSNDTSCLDENIMMIAAEELTEPQINYNSKESADLTDAINDSNESDDLINDDPEVLYDIDDTEVSCYLNNEEEVRYKKIIWEQMNKEYLEEQALKEAAKEASYNDMSEADKLKLDAAAKARKQKRQQKSLDAKNAAPPRTAAEATGGILTKKRLQSKINFDVLQQLFDKDDVELSSKKSRTDPERVDATEKQKEADNVNNYDEVYEDYQEHEDYQPDSYSIGYDNGYYGNDEPYNYGDGNDEDYY